MESTSSYSVRPSSQLLFTCRQEKVETTVTTKYEHKLAILRSWSSKDYEVDESREVSEIKVCYNQCIFWQGSEALLPVILLFSVLSFSWQSLTENARMFQQRQWTEADLTKKWDSIDANNDSSHNCSDYAEKGQERL